MTLSLVFEITLDSDYHIGAGHGLGMLVDSALQRDPDGRPVLRGTTVTGLLRDGMYRLLAQPPLMQGSYQACQASGLPVSDETPRYCGQQSPKQPDCPVCAIFGSPRVTRHWRISSARPVGEEMPAGKTWEPGSTAATIAPHVRVSPRTRRAEARKLFFREEGDGRLAFRFTATCETLNAEILKEAGWLTAAARMVRSLGSARRRGRGECRIHVVSISGVELPAGVDAETWLLDSFGEVALGLPAAQQAQWTVPQSDVTLVRSPAAATQSFTMRKQIIAQLCEPLIISERALAGNEFRGTDVIPGTALRGAFAGLAAARHNLADQASSTYAAFVALFFRGEARFSTLLPAWVVKDRDLYPTILAPLDLLSCELFPGYGPSAGLGHHGGRGFATAMMADILDAYCANCGEPHVDLKPLTGYLPLRSKAEPIHLQRVNQMHVRIDPISQRAESGALFGIDALAPGQYLMGTLEFRDQVAWRAFCDLVGLEAETSGQALTIRLGKASRRGYGKVTLWIEDVEEHPWLQVPLRERLPDLNAPFTLTCLTDTLMSDRWGRSLTAFDERWLACEIGVRLRVLRTFSGTRAIDSYNAYFGLPRTRDVALRAGSAVGLQIDEPLDTAGAERVYKHLETLERAGLGLRTTEGFGQVAFNHPAYNGCLEIADAARVSLADRPAIKPDDGTDTMLLRRERKFLKSWQEELDREKTINTVYRHEEFAALALALHRIASAPEQSLDDLLGQIGHLETLQAGQELAHLLDALVAWRKNKEPLGFFRADDKGGAAGVTELRRLVAKLQAKAGDNRHWQQLGLAELAERIAEAARAAKKESKS